MAKLGRGWKRMGLLLAAASALTWLSLAAGTEAARVAASSEAYVARI
jgi:hypothetical protein